MDDSKLSVELNKSELFLIVQALGQGQPPPELEVVQFKLYHRLKFKLTELKLNDFK